MENPQMNTAGESGNEQPFYLRFMLTAAQVAVIFGLVAEWSDGRFIGLMTEIWVLISVLLILVPFFIIELNSRSSEILLVPRPRPKCPPWCPPFDLIVIGILGVIGTIATVLPRLLPGIGGHELIIASVLFCAVQLIGKQPWNVS